MRRASRMGEAGRPRHGRAAVRGAFALLLLLLLAAPTAQAEGMLDAGEATHAGLATDLVQRIVRLDLWDAAQDEGQTRTYTLRSAAGDGASDGADGARGVAGVEARWRPAHGAWSDWAPLSEVVIEASGSVKAKHRGWDGVHDLALRLRLPNVATSEVTVLVVEARPGSAAYAFTTTLQASVLTFDAQVEARDGAQVLVAALHGGKVPEAVTAIVGAEHWPLTPEPSQASTWTLALPATAGQARLEAQFADGGILHGPDVTWKAAAPSGSTPASKETPDAQPPMEPLEPVDPMDGEATPAQGGGEGGDWAWTFGDDPAGSQGPSEPGQQDAARAPTGPAGLSVPGPGAALGALAVLAVARALALQDSGGPRRRRRRTGPRPPIL